MKRAVFTIVAVAVLALLSASASLAAVVQTQSASGLAKAVTFVTGTGQVAMLPGTSTLANYDVSIALLVVVALTFAATLTVALVARRT